MSGLDHVKDEDCTVDSETDCCRSCGVYHGYQCVGCQGRGFHRFGCSLSDTAPAEKEAALYGGATEMAISLKCDPETVVYFARRAAHAAFEAQPRLRS